MELSADCEASLWKLTAKPPTTPACWHTMVPMTPVSTGFGGLKVQKCQILHGA